MQRVMLHTLCDATTDTFVVVCQVKQYCSITPKCDGILTWQQPGTALAFTNEGAIFNFNFNLQPLPLQPILRLVGGNRSLRVPPVLLNLLKITTLKTTIILHEWPIKGSSKPD